MRFVIRPLVLAALSMAGPMALRQAAAQVDSREGIALQNEIYQLRAQVQALQNGGGGRAPAYAPYQPQPQPYGGNGNDLVAQLLTRVDTLDEQVRQLRGRLDELENQVRQGNADLGKRIDDLAFQANGQNNPSQNSLSQNSPSQNGLPQSGAPLSGPSQAGPRAPQPAPSQSVAAPGRTPETGLQDANAALARRDYAAAEATARQVLANRTSPRAYDANLVLAQALAGQRQYAQAAIAFDDTYNRSRKGSHAPDALLGLANALNAINEKNAACDSLGRLRGEFPQMRADIRDAAAVLSQKANCR